ncbi:hypothetical protein BKA70DRAFT_1178816 [Coprinopsis sp. MPI-PUGE-AT-0042]|nr:hypothetical protein BKA70DRAFT_1178816 [Coprinopsis sp. MPI-PUGE-AT-0042]
MANVEAVTNDVPAASEAVGTTKKKKTSDYWAKRRAAAKLKKKEARAGSGQQTAPAGSHPEPPPQVDGPVNDFFSSYSEFGFEYDPRRAAHDEFNRLCKFMKNIGAADFDRESAKEDFDRSIVAQFNFRFGTNADSLANWQAICGALGIEPVPQDLKGAKEAVYNTHVNLVDLTTNFKGIRSITKFATEKQLSEYTRAASGRVMRRNLVDKNTILWTLLRRILRPPPEGSRRDETGHIVRG